MDARKIWAVLALLIAPTYSNTLFPFGASEGDDFLPANDDGSTEELPITVNFPFFDHNHNSLFVNNNGAISFLVRVSQYTPDPFPLGDGRRLLTPFWGDVDTTNGGTLSYREVLRFSIDDNLFLEADQIIRDNNIDMRRFRSSWMFIATWDNVAFFGTSDNTIRNSFQAVLVTDGLYSFAIFNYGDINWTTGTASGGDSSRGLGGTPAQVGFNAGDGMTYYVVHGSRTAAVVDIELTTNIGVPGRWLFRTDAATIQSNECSSSGTISLFPLVGTMLGGTEVFISGPCFNHSSTVVCDFNGTEVGGNVLSNTSALCLTPSFYKIGRVPLRVSLDGGVTFDFQGVFAVLGIEDVPTLVWSSATSSDQRLNTIDVAWDTTALNFVTNIDIVVFGYYETANDISFSGPLLTLVTNVDYQLGNYNNIAVGQLNDPLILDVGVIGVVQTGVLPNAYAAIWSEIHALQWLHGHDSLTWCTTWISSETQADVNAFVEVTPACPCTLGQAELDIGRFTAHPQCDIDGTATTNCAHRPGAVHCVIVNNPSELGGGQECCYDAEGFILNVVVSDGGGFSHRRHHSGVAPYGEPGKVPFMSNFLADILPWTYCCRFRLPYDGEDEYCQQYRLKRPSQVCDGYTPPPPALGSGDPHFATLDSTMYTFNGFGEFTMLDAMDGAFVLQARCAPFATNSMDATVFVAMAAAFEDSDVIHVQLSDRRILDAYVRLQGGDQFSRVDFDQATRWTYSGVSVTGRNISADGLLIAFERGVGLQVKASNGAVSILLTVPESFRGQTKGLMGTWNGVGSDDFLTPQGTTLPSNLNTEEIHNQFGIQWEIGADSSLFYYETGENHETHTDRSYQPVFEPMINPAVDQQLVLEVCGDNQFCVFDFQTTGSQSFARASLESFEQYERAVESLAVVQCPTLSTPTNAALSVSRYTEGGVANYTCDQRSLLVTLTCQADGTWSDGEVPTCLSETNGLPIYVICVIAVAVVIVIIIFIALTYKICCSASSSPKVEDTPRALATEHGTHRSGYDGHTMNLGDPVALGDLSGELPKPVYNY